VLDGMMTVGRAFSRAKELGYSALAVTEHNNLASMFHALDESTSNDVQYIPGVEFNFKESAEDRNPHQLVVLATTHSGLKSILKTTYQSYCRDVNYPYILWGDLEILDTEGVYVLSGGAGGVLAVKTLLYGPRIGNELVDRFLMVFKDRFFIETNIPFDNKQKEINMLLKDISEKKGVRRVLALDSHFAVEDDRYLFNIFLAIQNKGSIYEKDSLFYYRPPLLSEDEIRSQAKESGLIADVDATVELSRLCDDPREYLKPSERFLMPEFDVKSADNYEEFIAWRNKSRA